jgi:hypothetical protein
MTLQNLLLVALKQRWLEIENQYQHTANNNDVALMFRAILDRAELLKCAEHEQDLKEQLSEIAHQFPKQLVPLCDDLFSSCFRSLIN